MFVLRLHTDPPSVNLKCQPGVAEQLRAAHPRQQPLRWSLRRRDR